MSITPDKATAALEMLDESHHSDVVRAKKHAGATVSVAVEGDEAARLQALFGDKHAGEVMQQGGANKPTVNVSALVAISRDDAPGLA